MAEFDVAVVGAGPSGSATAKRFAMQGIRSVALIDKAVFPRDKSCGDGLGPGVVQAVKKLELESCFEPHSRIEFLSVSSPSGLRASGPLPLVGGSTPEGYVIPRIEFDNYIFSAAISDGVTDLSGSEFLDATYSFGRKLWTIKLQSNDKLPIEISAKILIGADGASSRVRRVLGVGQNTDDHLGTGARMYVHSSSEMPKDLRLDFKQGLLPAYGWVFPIGRKRANFGVGIDVSRYKKQGIHLRDLLKEYQKDIGIGGDVEFDEKSYLAFPLPYGSQLPRLAHWEKSAALVGDAGSMINPLTGEGIFYGMWAGIELADQVTAALHEGSDYQMAIRSYERSFRIKFMEHFHTNWRMKQKVADPKWCNMVVAACKKDERVLSELIDLMMGDKQRIGFGLLGRIAFSAVF